MPADSESTALEYIDDHFALVDDQPVSVNRLWQRVIADAANGRCHTITLICPTWWPTRRVDVVRGAAGSSAANVVLRRRMDILGDRSDTESVAIVEIAPDFVIVGSGGAVVAAKPRRADPARVAAAVAEAVTDRAVVVDAPAGLAGARALGSVIAQSLRDKGCGVTVVDPDWLLSTAQRATPTRQPRRDARRGARVAAAAAGSLSLIGAGWTMWPDQAQPTTAEVPAAVLVEDGVAVDIPANWRIRRVLDGPGSARIEVASESDPHAVLHITRSRVPRQQTLAVAADVLRVALQSQPAGVFVDFRADGHRAGRSVISYREVRAQHHIAWLVLLDRGLRIAVGCQSAPDDDQAIREPCDRAVRSARAMF